MIKFCKVGNHQCSRISNRSDMTSITIKFYYVLLVDIMVNLCRAATILWFSKSLAATRQTYLLYSLCRHDVTSICGFTGNGDRRPSVVTVDMT